MAVKTNKFLCEDQPLRTGAMAQYKYTEALQEKMQFYSRYGDLVDMSVRDGSLLYVPRGLCPLGQYDDRVLNPLPVAINCKLPPRSDEQAQCIKDSVMYLKNGTNHIMEAPTGWGKTYGGCAVAVELGQTTAIIVPKQDLMYDWKDTLINLIGIPENKIGLIQQDVCDYKDKWFVLVMVHSLVQDLNKYPPEMKKYFGTVLFDETHKMAAETFMRAAQMFPAMYRLGLSATPNRDDGKDPVIAANIGKVLVVGKQIPMSPKVLVKKTAWEIPKWKRWNSEKKEYEYKKMPYAPGRMAGVYKHMAADHARNMIITDFVRQSYGAGRRTLVLSDTVEHLKVLAMMFGQNGVAPTEQGFYVGGMKKPELKTNANKRVICGTYAMTSEGTNYPIWDTLVLATPRAKVKQAIGRVMRSMEDKNKPVILDLLDMDSIFTGFYNSREVEYHQVKAEIVKLWLQQ